MRRLIRRCNTSAKRWRANDLDQQGAAMTASRSLVPRPIV